MTENSKSHFRPDIQGLRALAVLAVMAFHAGLPIPGGFAGVDIFFVISGFVVTGVLVREGLGSGRIRLASFFVRRFKRLIPALAALVTVIAIASLLLLSPLGGQQTAAKTGIGAMLLVANAVIQRENGLYFSAAATTNPLLNTWSLSVEEQFYLVVAPTAALAFALCWGYKQRRGIAFTLIAVATAGSLAVTIATEFIRLPILPWWSFGFYSPLSRAWEFGLGALVAVWASPRIGNVHGLGPPTRQVMSLAGLTFIVASLWALPTSPWPGIWTLAPTVGTALILGAGGSTWIGKVLARSSAVAVGDASYSLYLWHWPFVSFAIILLPELDWMPLVALILSIIPAVLFYRKLETPLRYIRLSQLRMGLLITASMGVPILASAMLLFIANSALWPAPISAMSESLSKRSLANEFSCDAGAMSPEVMKECVWGATLSGPPIYLVGDSHAAHLSDAVVAAGQILSRPVYIATTSACPFLDNEVPRPGASVVENAVCREFVQDTLGYLSGAAHGTVVIGLAPSYPEAWLGMDDDSRGGADQFEVSLERAVGRLQEAGQRVVISLPVPRPPNNWDPRVCSLPKVILGGCMGTVSEENELVNSAQTRHAIRLVADATGALEVDPYEVLCSQGKCPTAIDGTLVYRDGSHLTPHGSLLLTGLFVEALRQSGEVS